MSIKRTLLLILYIIGSHYSITANNYIKSLISKIERQPSDIDLFTPHSLIHPVIVSDDGKISCHSWQNIYINDSITNRFIHEVIYPSASGENRSISTQVSKHDVLLSLIDTWKEELTIIHSIEYLTEGIYLIATETATRHKLYAIDIRCGILKDAYIFPKLDSEDIPDRQITTLKEKDNDQKPFILIGNILKVRNLENGQFWGYDYYYFNQSSFHPFDKMGKITGLPLGDHNCELDLMFWKDYDGQTILDEYYLKVPFSLYVGMAYDNYRIDIDEDYTVDVNISMDDEEKEDPIIPIITTLKPYCGQYYIQNLDLSKVPTRAEHKTSTTPQVDMMCGLESAFNQELIRYTAITFASEGFSKEECLQIRWAISIDGEDIQHLEYPAYWGSQIELYMKDEWIGKTITVMAYMDGEEINNDIAIKTEVIEY